MTNPLCIHGKRTWERCEECEKRQPGGFVPAQPSSNEQVDQIMRLWLDCCERIGAGPGFEQITALKNAARAAIERLQKDVRYYSELAHAPIERATVEPSEHPPELMAVVDLWQDRANANRKRYENGGLSVNGNEAEVIERVLEDIRRATVPPSGALNVTPIANVTLNRGEIIGMEIYAPGLPDGRHELFPVPLSPNGAMQPFMSSSEPPSVWRSVAVDPPPPGMDRIVLAFTGDAYSAEYANELNAIDHLMWLEFPLVPTVTKSEGRT